METGNIKIQLQLAVYKKRDYWIAFCPALKIFGYSREGEEGALKDFDRAIDTFLYVHEKRNSLENALKNLGWKRDDHHFDIPKFFNTDLSALTGKTIEQREREIIFPIAC